MVAATSHRPADGSTSGRVAQVIASTSDGRQVRGSGYRVTSGAVLTAAHVVADAVSVRVRFDADEPTEWSALSTDVRAADGADVAVVVLGPAVASDPVRPALFGRVGARAAVVECATVGFPRFKVRPSQVDGGCYRDRVQAVGRIPVLSNSREGTLEVITDAPDRIPDHSPWEGMSGAAVWCGDRIVGVVSKHHRADSPGRLAAARIDHWLDALPTEQRVMFGTLLGLPVAPLPDVVPPDSGEAFVSGYAAQVRDTAPDELVDRADELAELVEFCAGDEPYAWWQADPWAGKSALAAWFTLHPPAGVTVVSFFVTSRLAGQSDSDAFTDTLLAELAAVVGEATPSVATPAGRDRERRRLLDKAAAQAAEQGRRLLLVVDGLDEDTGAGSGSRLPSIASFLPRKPPDALRVLVTSRFHPGLPGDVPADHPLRRCAPRRLDPLPWADGMAQAAGWELNQGLHSHDRLRVDVLCYLAASGGGLTRAELAELAGEPGWALDGLLGGASGRILRTRRTPDSDRVYLFAHETLQRTAEKHLAGDLASYRDRIHRWVEDYQRQGWPDATPAYLLRPYGTLLVAAEDARRLAALAADPARHDRMLARQHNDADALAEIRSAQQVLLDRPGPDLPDLAALGTIAAAEWRLRSRNSNLPAELPAVWARIGDPERAEQIAGTITDPCGQAGALADVARALAGTDQDRARQAAEHAERVADTVADPRGRARALASIVRAVARTDPDRARQVAERAERVAGTVTVPHRQVRMLAEIAGAVAGADPARARQVAERAERLVGTITDPRWRARALADVARAVAGTDPDRAERIAWGIANPHCQARAFADVARAVVKADPDRARRTADRAERVARAMTDPHWQARAFADVAGAVAGMDPDRAERAARGIGNPHWQARALADVAGVVAGTDPDRAEEVAEGITNAQCRAGALADVAGVVARTDPGRARRIAERAERVARMITDPHGQARALAGIARVVARTDPGRARGIADRAEQIARTITNPHWQARALADVAHTLAGTGSVRAERLARTDPDRAEQVARSISDPRWQAGALADVAGAVARMDPGRAERIARSVTDPPSQARALADVAAAVAGTDPDRAEWLARSISDPHWRARAFSGVAGAVVRADPDRARRLAAQVLSTGNWLEALGVVARLDHPAFVLICDHALHVLTLRADPL